MGFTTFPGSENKWKRTDWSRPTFSVVRQEPAEKESKPNVMQPRFSVLGKNQVNTKKPEVEEKPATCSFKRSTFQLHLSTKSSANYKFDQSTPQSPTTSPEPEPEQITEETQTKRKTKVQFDPVCLERVCLFLESQCPIELKEAHDKQLTRPSFRIVCPHWPRPESHLLNNDQKPKKKGFEPRLPKSLKRLHALQKKRKYENKRGGGGRKEREFKAM